MKTIEQINILFVDDEASVLNSLRRFLRKERYQTLFAGNGQEALEILATQSVDILVTDLRMPQMGGLELIQEAKRRAPQTIRIILSASRDVEQVIAGINAGEVFRFIPKPLDPEPFKQILLDAVEYFLMKTEREELLDELASKNRSLEAANNSLLSLTEALHTSEEQFRAIVEMANDAVIMSNEKSELVLWNKAAETIFGYSAEEAIGRNPYDLLAPEQYRSAYAKIREEIVRRAGEKNYTGVIHNGITQHKSGRIIPVELSGSIAQVAGKPHVISVLRDISARVAVEDARKRFEALQKVFETKIEKSLLQAKVPDGIIGVDMASCSIPSKHLDGDFTDFVVYGEKKFDILIADVMGKGVQAALVGAGVKSSFLKALSQHDCAVTPRPNCPARISDPQYLGEVVANVHAMTAQHLIDLEMYVTLFFSRFNLEERTMAFVDCGHTKTVHFHAATGDCSCLAGDNLPLGMVATARYQTQVVSFQPGDMFLYYSDGVSEAEHESGEQFGTRRLIELVQANHQQEAALIVESIRDEVLRFTGSDNFSDDFSCIAVKIA